MPGGSWKTGLAGWLLIASAVIAFIADSIAKSGIPDTIMEWVMFGTMLVTGVMGIVSKDYDKSNAPHPAAVSHTVPPTT